MNDFHKNPAIIKERRVAPRHKINLKSSVLITAICNSADGKESYLILQAQLRDVSLTGLALIISNDDMRELEIFGNDYVMRLLLPLPVEAIELEAIPARYQRLDETEKSKFLIGSHITNYERARPHTFYGFYPRKRSRGESSRRRRRNLIFLKIES